MPDYHLEKPSVQYKDTLRDKLVGIAVVLFGLVQMVVSILLTIAFLAFIVHLITSIL